MPRRIDRNCIREVRFAGAFSTHLEYPKSNGIFLDKSTPLTHKLLSLNQEQVMKNDVTHRERETLMISITARDPSGMIQSRGGGF
jgi:hypothetical protein